ncbi:hypothetical protein C8R43DRAFT_1128515 [Mycena crocata]|nr:hypothetical protein C8R43DRAFT_1128515 [Mycena crocata]
MNTAAVAAVAAASAALEATTPYGYYTFVPYPVPTTASGPPLTDMDPAAVAAMAAANAMILSRPIHPPGYIHVVTGIPPGLAKLVRSKGPWTANVIYSVAPDGDLAPIEEITPAPEWYCVIRGHFVGIFNQYAKAQCAIRGVSNAAHKQYPTQAFALEAFNDVAGWGGIEVV